MAQPKNRRRPGDEDKTKSVNRVELENLQKKADGNVQKRNDFNTQASTARSQRDLLHNKRKELVEAMNKAKADRDAGNVQLKEAKTLRAEYQNQAKELIQKKRGRMAKEGPKEPGQRSPGLRAQELLAEINDLDFGQQTRVLSTAQENELLKQLRAKRHEYDQIKKEVSKRSQLKVDLSDLDGAIDTLFAKAEEQHNIVMALHKQGNEAHDRFIKLVNEIGAVSAEANKHHKHFIDCRTKADEQHAAFLEIRDKMLELRGKEFADRNEARQVIRELRAHVREQVANPQKLEQHADSSLELLKKGGKIKLG